MMTTTITSTTTWRRQRQHDDDCGGVNVSENKWKESHFSRRRRHGEAHLLDDCRFIINFRVTKTITTTKTTTAARQIFCWGSFLGYLSAGHNRHVVSKTHLRHLSDVAENAEPSVVVSRPSVCWRLTCRCLCWGLGSIGVICKTYLSSSPQVSRLGFEPRTSTVNLCPIS